MTKEEIEEARQLQKRPDRFAFEAWMIRHADELLYFAEAFATERANGIRRGLELAKEHISFDDNAHVTGRLGEGRPNWADAERAVEEECK